MQSTDHGCHEGQLWGINYFLYSVVSTCMFLAAKPTYHFPSQSSFTRYWYPHTFFKDQLLFFSSFSAYYPFFLSSSPLFSEYYASYRLQINKKLRNWLTNMCLQMSITKVFISSRNRGCFILKQKETYTKYKDSCLSHPPCWLSWSKGYF